MKSSQEGALKAPPDEPRALHREAAPYEPSPNDEISLVDLWRALVAQRQLILVVVALCLTAGVSYALLKPVKYRFMASIEIGQLPGTDPSSAGPAPIDPPDTVLAKLTEGYIPKALRTYRQEMDTDVIPDVTARVPRNSRMVVLEVKGPTADGPVLLTILGSVAAGLLEDHQRQTDALVHQLESRFERERIKLAELEDDRLFTFARQVREREIEDVERILRGLIQQEAVISAELQGELSAAQARLADLGQQEGLLQERIERLQLAESLITDQIEEIREANLRATDTRAVAVRHVQDPAHGMTLLMIDSEIQQNRTRLANLEERLVVDFPNQRDELYKRLEENRSAQQVEGLNVEALKVRLDKRLEDNRREQERHASLLAAAEANLNKFELEWERNRATQAQVVRELEARLEGIRATRVIAGPASHVKPEGPGRLLIVALSLLFGLMLGVFSAFFAEFLRNARAQPA